VAAPLLVLLNGAPGIGKSTLARRWAADAPGRAVVDPDELRRAVTGEPDETARRARGQALSTTAANLGDGRDVAVPQLVARASELERFEDVARSAGARFTHVLLVDAGGDPVARFHRRGGPDPWHDEARAVVAAAGGDEVLERYLAGLTEVLAARTDTKVVRSVEGDPEHTWAALREVLG
jgi:predicted kinase